MPKSMTAFMCVSVVDGLQYSVDFFIVQKLCFTRMENVQGKITTNNFCWKEDSFTCLVPDQFTSQSTKMVSVFHYNEISPGSEGYTIYGPWANFLCKLCEKQR